MKNYYVQYEIEVKPTTVEVLLKCRDEQDQQEVYLDRLSNSNLQKVQKIEEVTTIVKINQ